MANHTPFGTGSLFEAAVVLLSSGLIALACYLAAVALAVLTRQYRDRLPVPSYVLWLTIGTQIVWGTSRLSVIAAFYLPEPAQVIHAVLMVAAAAATCVNAVVLLWHTPTVLSLHADGDWQKLQVELRQRSSDLEQQAALRAQMESQLRMLNELQVSDLRGNPVQMALDRLNGVVERLENLYEQAEAQSPVQVR